MYNTIEKFEKDSRVPLILDIVLKGKEGLMNWFHKYQKVRQNKADRVLEMYVKNTADFERYQRELERNKTNALFYIRS